MSSDQNQQAAIQQDYITAYFVIQKNIIHYCLCLLIHLIEVINSFTANSESSNGKVSLIYYNGNVWLVYQFDQLFVI